MIQFHFNIFSEKKAGIKICIFRFGEPGSGRVPERSISHYYNCTLKTQTIFGGLSVAA